MATDALLPAVASRGADAAGRAGQLGADTLMIEANKASINMCAMSKQASKGKYKYVSQ